MNSSKNIFLEAYGWYGTIAILGAYALLSFGYLDSDSALYQFFNASGALGIVLVSLTKRAFQPALLNAIWAAIGVMALLPLLV